MKRINGFWRRMILPTIVLIWAAAYFLEVLSKGPKNVYLIKPVFFGMVILYFVNGYIDYRKYKLEQKIAKEGAANHGNAAEAKSENGTIEDTQIASKKELAQNGDQLKGWRALLKKPGVARTIGLFLTLAIYTAIIGTVGFFISTLLMVVAVFLIMGERKWKRIAVMAPLAVIAIFLIFKVGLKVPLPMGFFG